jgi:general secretion pathway protein C
MALTSLPESWLRAAAALYGRYGARLPALAAALFAILLGRALADLAWTLVPVPEAARWAPPPAAPVAPRPGAAAETNPAATAGLFGRYQAPSSSDTALLSAPDTALNLTLLGLLADDREQYSRALIGQGSEEGSYAVGDDVGRGVTLQAIFPDRVILSRNGRLETLRLERDKPGAGGDSSPGPLAQAEERSPSTPPQLAQIRDEVLKDPAKAPEYIRVQPANVGGQLKGYRVYPGKDRSAFSAAGLRPGDLVTSVNGVQLDDPAKALQLLGDLSQAGQVNLVVERGGQSQNISINLGQ